MGAQPPSAREERTLSTSDGSAEEGEPPNPASPSVNGQFLRPSGEAAGSFQRKMILTAIPGGRTETEAPVSYRLLSQEHRAEWPGGGPPRGLGVEEEKLQWMKSPGRATSGPLHLQRPLSGRSLLRHTPGSFPPFTQVSLLMLPPQRPFSSTLILLHSFHDTHFPGEYITY